MLKAILITASISAPAGAFIASYVGYRLGYNLYDWAKDHVLALIAKIKGKL